jgi:hypothetical protein
MVSYHWSQVDAASAVGLLVRSVDARRRASNARPTIACSQRVVAGSPASDGDVVNGCNEKRRDLMSKRIEILLLAR